MIICVWNFLTVLPHRVLRWNMRTERGHRSTGKVNNYRVQISVKLLDINFKIGLAFWFSFPAKMTRRYWFLSWSKLHSSFYILHFQSPYTGNLIESCQVQRRFQQSCRTCVAHSQWFYSHFYDWCWYGNEFSIIVANCTNTYMRWDLPRVTVFTT